MADLQAATALAWGEAADLQAATALAWGEAADLQSRGSAYTPPGAGSGTVVTPGSLAPTRDILPAISYVDTAALTVIDLRDNSALPVTGVNLDLSDGSVLWTLQARGNADLAARLQAGEQPATVEVQIGTDAWRFVIEDIEQPLSFAASEVTVRGRSLAAIAGTPWQVQQVWLADALTSAAQIAALANTYTGVEVRWTVPDWLIPEGAWSATTDPLGVVRALAAAVGADVEADRTAMRLVVRSRYPSAPNLWATTAPDVQIPWEAVEFARQERADTPPYDAVLVAGQQNGGTLQARLEGTAGGKQAPMVTDPLLTDSPALLERATALLYSFGGRVRETRTLPLLGGVVPRGALVRCVEPTVTWTGMVRSVSVQATLAQARQTLVLERPTSFPEGVSEPAELCDLDPFYYGGATDGRTILALHGEGPDGSTTFLDSSTVANVMTGFGTAAISVARWKFGTSSIYLDGAGSYLKAASAGNFDLSSGRLCFEAQVWPEAFGGVGTSQLIFCACENLTGAFAFFRLLLVFDGRVQAAIQTSTGGSGIALTTVATVPLQQWSHIEFNQYDGEARIYINGTLAASATGWPAYPLTKTQHVALGVHGNGYTDAAYPSFKGNLADVRLTVRARRHSAAFTPPTQTFCDHA